MKIQKINEVICYYEDWSSLFDQETVAKVNPIENIVILLLHLSYVVLTMLLLNGIIVEAN